MDNSIVIAILSSSVLATVISWIFKKIDSKKDKQDAILTSISELRTELREHIDNDIAKDTTQARTRILQFSDETRRGILHSQEAWEQCMEDCDHYTNYCIEHPNYKNSKAVLSIAHLKEVYARCLKGDLKFL